MSDDELQDSIRQLLESAADRIPISGVGRYLDFRLNVGTLLAIVVLIGGGYLAIRDQVMSAVNAGIQNASEIRRVESDSRERDRDLRIYVDKTFGDHMLYQHRKGTAFSLRDGDDDSLFDGQWSMTQAGGR